jgi:uncharacterized protein (DUF433 family)
MLRPRCGGYDSLPSPHPRQRVLDALHDALQRLGARTSRLLMKKAGGLVLRHVDRVANGQGVWYAGDIICGIHHSILPPDLRRPTIREHTVRSQRSHPYIEKRPGYRGGRAIIAGTNFPISSVAVYILWHGMLPEELVRRFPHLTLAQVDDALSYYYDHQAEVDAEIEKDLGQDAMATQLPGVSS